MTNPKWLIGIGVAFVLLTLISNVLEGIYLGGVTGTKLQIMISLPFPPTLSWLQNLWAMLWFDYSFFHGGWSIIKYVFFWPVSFGLVVSYGAQLLMAIFEGIRSAIRSLTGGAV